MEGNDGGFTTEEELLQAHRKEKKDLQAKIQALKKTATKGDKKKKKEVHEEIAKLETDLQAKHTAELASFSSKAEVITKPDILEDFEQICLDDLAPKVSKAQKRRNKRDQLNKERELRIAEQEVENESGQRNVEILKIKEKLQEKFLMIFEIPSDGDCLYAAIDHGLGSASIGVPNLRRLTGNYIKEHRNNYLPFLCNPQTGDQLNDDQLTAYCDKIASSKQWGGQVELDALSHVIRKTIVVVQAEGPDLLMGEEYKENGQIILSYHRHMYRLGEHYNSVQQYVAETDI